MKKKPKAGNSPKNANARKALFVDAFFRNGMNATQAAIEAGYSKKTAYSQGHRLLRNDEVRRQIETRRAQLVQISQLTTDDILRSIARTVLFDPRKLFDEKGRLKKPAELDDDTALALQGIKVTDKGIEFRASDKGTAREQAAKILNLYQDQPPPPPAQTAEVKFDHVRRYAFLLRKMRDQELLERPEPEG